MKTPGHSQLEPLARFAEALADAARRQFAPHIGQAGHRAECQPASEPARSLKPDRSFVTELDRAIELVLRERIADAFPTHGIHGEEGGVERGDAEWLWVLDPIDGTAPFIAGIPVFGCLIALLHEGTPVIGVMDFPVTAERWVGVAGQATRHQGQPCATRPCASLAAAMMSASNPDFFSAEERPALDALRERTAWRIYGGCCLAYGRLASGRTDLAIDARLALHDWAPFVPVIEGAGGVITDWRGRPLVLHNASPRILAAGDAARHREALALIEPWS